MNPFEIRIVRADTEVHWGVVVDCLVADTGGKVQKFGGEMLIDKHFPGPPSARLRPYFDGLRDVWRKHSSSPSDFIDAMEIAAKQIIDAPVGGL